MLRLLTALTVLALLPISVGAQQVALDSTDVAEMIEAAVEYERTEAHPKTFGNDRAGRPFYVNSAALEAFQKVVPGLSRIPEEGRSHQVRAREAVVTCAQGRDCGVINDGILLNIKSLIPTERGFALRINPEYNRDGKVVQGYLTILTFERIEGGKWKVSEGLVLVP